MDFNTKLCEDFVNSTKDHEDFEGNIEPEDTDWRQVEGFYLGERIVWSEGINYVAKTISFGEGEGGPEIQKALFELKPILSRNKKDRRYIEMTYQYNSWDDDMYGVEFYEVAPKRVTVIQYEKI